MDSVDEKLTALPRLADAVNAIQLTMAQEVGKRSAMRYLGHIVTVALGGLLGAITGHSHPQ
jgi:hypothetical protein